MESKTNADLAKAIRGFFEQHVTALQGVLEKLPEPLKSDIQKLKDSLNAQLAKLPPLDQVPAAQDAGWAINSFVDSWTRLQEYSAGLLSKLQKMADDISGHATALHSWEKKVTDGDLVEKPKVKELTEKAFTDGASSVMPQVVAMREEQVALAGLPKAPKNILELAADKFLAAMTAAKANLKALTDIGFALNGKGKVWVEDSVWMDATAFQGQMTKIQELLPKGSPKGDPMRGGPAPTEKKPHIFA
jgi:hypothetical protein